MSLNWHAELKQSWQRCRRRAFGVRVPPPSGEFRSDRLGGLRYAIRRKMRAALTYYVRISGAFFSQPVSDGERVTLHE
jgi:hypothetical protein